MTNDSLFGFVVLIIYLGRVVCCKKFLEKNKRKNKFLLSMTQYVLYTITNSTYIVNINKILFWLILILTSLKKGNDIYPKRFVKYKLAFEIKNTALQGCVQDRTFFVVASLGARGAFKIVACFLHHDTSKVCLQVHFCFI